MRVLLTALLGSLLGCYQGRYERYETEHNFILYV